MLGRLRIKLFSEISKKDPVPSKEDVESFVFEKLNFNKFIGELYASILLLSDFSWESYDRLEDLADVKRLLIALERFPLKGDFFIELENCPDSLPDTTGILIKCFELEKVDHGFVYSIYILGEEGFPDSIIDYIEVRACECLPDPLVCSIKMKNKCTSDLNEIAKSSNAMIALKSLLYLLNKKFQKHKKSKEKEIVKTTDLFPVSDNLSARFLKQGSGRMELALIIGDAVSAEELRSAWPKIDTLRTRLRENQGTDLNQAKFSFLYNYYQMHKNGWSYNLIAMDLNYDCLVNLCQASDEIIDIDSTCTKSLGYIGAYQLLKSVRMKEKDILDWLNSGLKEIQNGNCPWPPQTGPVDKQRVRDALRQWEREELSQKIVVQQPPETKMVPPQSLETPAMQRYNQMAQNLLSQAYPDLYGEYQAALATAISETGYIGYIMQN